MPASSHLLWERVGEVTLVVHSHDRPEIEEWKAFIASSEMRDPAGVVVVSNQVKLTPTHRNLLQEHLQVVDRERAKPVRTAVLTESLLTRGMVTALRWFGIQMSAFSHAELDEALAYAGVPLVDVKRVSQRLEQMKRTLVPPHSASASGDGTAGP